MKKIPHISDAEWKIMKTVWCHSPITANEIIEGMENSNWKPKTIKTLLSRLVKKEALDFKKEGRSYLYFPLVTEKECIKAENHSFLHRVYDGALNVMFTNFLEQQELSQEDIEELKKILNEKKSK